MIILLELSSSFRSSQSISQVLQIRHANKNKWPGLICQAYTGHNAESVQARRDDRSFNDSKRADRLYKVQAHQSCVCNTASETVKSVQPGARNAGNFVMEADTARALKCCGGK